MKLERNRAERRSKRGVPILYNGIPYLIFAALAAGFLFGAPQLAATSTIAQADKGTVSLVQRRQFLFAFAGYLGKTNTVLDRGFTEKDFTYTGSKVWVDDQNGNWRLKFTSSGTLTLKKKIIVDAWLLGGGAGGGSTGNSIAAAGGGGGRTGQWNAIELAANVAYSIAVGAGGSPSANGGATGLAGGAYNIAVGGGSTPNPRYIGGAGGSGGGGGAGGTGGSNGGNGTGGMDGAGGVGQGSTTCEFGNTSWTLYAGGGGGGAAGNSWDPNYGNGGAGGGARGGGHYGGTGFSAAANTGGGGGGGGGKGDTSVGGTGGSGGSGILILRNHR